MPASKFTILEYYNECNKIKNYVEEYQSTSDKKSGKSFWYINTNFRSIYAFIECVKGFLPYNGKSREAWEQYVNGEEKAKHWTTRMQQSKLFTKTKDAYKLTAKGDSFKNFLEYIENNELNDAEIWLFLYMYILNSYFNLTPNYIVKRCKEIVSIMNKNGFDYVEFKRTCEEYLINYPKNKGQMFEKDAFWYITFFKDKDFIELFKNSTGFEKQQLIMKVQAESKIKNSVDLLGHKFTNSGQYTYSTVNDDIKVLYITNELLARENNNLLEFFDNLCLIMGKFFHIRKNVIQPFFLDNYDIFEIVFQEAIKNITLDDELNNEDDEAVDNYDDASKEIKIDDTTSNSTRAIRHTSQILKRIAREKANNKCELEILFGCRYFTSKETSENYLEIHHLIPYEFNNDFENTLETTANYVALCPHCHRLIHHGVDSEREPALRLLYNKRINDLKKAGLNIKFKTLLSYYGFSEEELKKIKD